VRVHLGRAAWGSAFRKATCGQGGADPAPCFEAFSPADLVPSIPASADHAPLGNLGCGLLGLKLDIDIGQPNVCF
jgi:hypothetical protein